VRIIFAKTKRTTSNGKAMKNASQSNLIPSLGVTAAAGRGAEAEGMKTNMLLIHRGEIAARSL